MILISTTTIAITSRTMNESANRVTAHQPQQPKHHEYHKDRPKHIFFLLLYEALPHVLTSNPAAYPPKGVGSNNLPLIPVRLS